MANIKLKAILRAYSKLPFYNDFPRDVYSQEGVEPGVQYVRVYHETLDDEGNPISGEYTGEWVALDTALLEKSLKEYQEQVEGFETALETISVSIDYINNTLIFTKMVDGKEIVTHLTLPEANLDNKTINKNDIGQLYVVDTPDEKTLKEVDVIYETTDENGNPIPNEYGVVGNKISGKLRVTGIYVESDGTIISGSNLSRRLKDAEKNIEDLEAYTQGKGGHLDPYNFGVLYPLNPDDSGYSPTKAAERNNRLNNYAYTQLNKDESSIEYDNFTLNPAIINEKKANGKVIGYSGKYDYRGLGEYRVGDTLTFKFRGQNIPNVGLFVNKNGVNPIGGGTENTGIFLQTSGHGSVTYNKLLYVTGPYLVDAGGAEYYSSIPNFTYREWLGSNKELGVDTSYIVDGVGLSHFGIEMLDENTDYVYRITTSSTGSADTVNIRCTLNSIVGGKEIFISYFMNTITHYLDSLENRYAVVYGTGDFYSKNSNVNTGKIINFKIPKIIPVEIPNQTKVQNTYDGVLWVYVEGETADTSYWLNSGRDVVVVANNYGVLGVVTGSLDQYKGKIESDGTISINGLKEKLDNIITDDLTSVDPTANSLAKRTEKGQLKTNDPIEDNDSINLKYFNSCRISEEDIDSLFGIKWYKINYLDFYAGDPLFEVGSEYGLSKQDGGNYPETYSSNSSTTISDLKKSFTCGGVGNDYCRFKEGQGVYGFASYLFKGWYLDKATTKPFNGIIPAGTTGDITLYAKIECPYSHNY